MDTQGSAQEIAYRLLGNIAYAERKIIASGFAGEMATREWILDTYAECLKAAYGERKIGPR